MSSLVAKGNTINVPAGFLGGDQGKKITVNWSQSLKSRSAEYWVCKYTVKNGGSSSGVIFVQANKLDEFKAKKTSGEEYTLEVDGSFQYGQDKAQTKRFLVFHDKGNKPYQHRFVENMYTEMGGKAADFVESMGYKDIGKVEDLLKHFLGDYLKDY